MPLRWNSWTRPLVPTVQKQPMGDWFLTVAEDAGADWMVEQGFDRKE
jgi:hypothetical protein